MVLPVFPYLPHYLTIFRFNALNYTKAAFFQTKLESIVK
jgi:hypothetical protein